MAHRASTSDDGGSRTAGYVQESISLRPDLRRSNSYDGRVVIPITPDYRHQTYADDAIDDTLDNEKVKSFVRDNTGLLLIACSQAFFAVMNVFAKLLANPPPPAQPVSTFQLIFVRMSLTYVFAVTYMYTTGVRDFLFGPKEVRWLLVLRGSVGFLGLFSLYFTLQYLSLSVATVLTFLVPFFTLFLGYVFLGESFTYREAVAGLVALVGVLFIARPFAFFGGGKDEEEGDGPGGSDPWQPTSAQRLTAVLVSLLGVVGASGAYVTIRYIGKRAHALISVSIFSLFSCLYSAAGLIVTRQPIVIPKGRSFLYLVALGICGFVAQFLLTMGLQREKAGRGTTAIYLQLIFSLFWEKVVFDTTPGFFSIVGMLLILGSTLYVALTTTSHTQNENVATTVTVPGNSDQAALVPPVATTAASTDSDPSGSVQDRDLEAARIVSGSDDFDIGDDEELLADQEDLTDSRTRT